MSQNLPTGFQSYSVKHLKDMESVIPEKVWKQLCIVKDEKPSFIKDKSWKQTYSFQEKSKVKSFGLKCIK
ncbi:MAG TPA: hypothetical protein VGB37_00635 [Candidatus Lokiarchaeia archaeon]